MHFLKTRGFARVFLLVRRNKNELSEYDRKQIIINRYSLPIGLNNFELMLTNHIQKRWVFVMTDYAYYNGVYCPYGAAAIPLTDRSIFFSEAVYDVVLGVNGIPYQLDEHLERLFQNSARIGLTGIPEKEEIESVIDTLISEASAVDFLIYVQLSGNGERRNHARSGGAANLLVTVTECKAPTRLEKIKAITLPDNRHGLCDIKTTSLLPAVISIEEAKRRGADVAIFHKGEAVTESSHANVCILKGGEVVAHQFDSAILPGITQRNLEAACKQLGIPFTLREFSVSELFDADAVMVISTTKLIKICTEIDGKTLAVSDFARAEVLFRFLLSDLTDKTRRNVT